MDIRSKSHYRRVQHLPLLRLFFNTNAVTSRRLGRVKRHLRPREPRRRRHPGRKRPNPRLERQSPRLRPHRLWFNRLSSRRWLLPRRFGQNIKSIDGDAIQYCKKLAREGAKVSAVPMTPFYNPAKAATNPTDLVRFAICKKRDTIEEAAKRIRENPLV